MESALSRPVGLGVLVAASLVIARQSYGTVEVVPVAGWQVHLGFPSYLGAGAAGVCLLSIIHDRERSEQNDAGDAPPREDTPPA